MAIVDRAAHGVVAAALIASSCGHAAPAPPPPPSNRAADPPAPAALGAHRCAATLIPIPDYGDGSWSDGIFIDPPAAAELVCDEYRDHCKATLPITFLNCRAESITIQSELPELAFDQPWISTTGTFPHVIGPGASWTIEASACGEGTTHASFMVGASVMAGTLESAAVHITNPARDRDLAACTACNGDWGIQGMIQTIDACPGSDPGDSCVCRATDAGTACDDSDDCQGWCEAEQFVVEYEAGSPAIDYGHWTGHCSEFTSQRSCASPIPHGASHEPAGPREITESCVD